MGCLSQDGSASQKVPCGLETSRCAPFASFADKRTASGGTLELYSHATEAATVGSLPESDKITSNPEILFVTDC